MGMKKMYQNGIALLIATLFIAFVSSCISNDHIEQGPVSSLSMYHASPDAPDLDILVDDQKINSVPFKYGITTNYLQFAAGIRNFKFKPFGGSTVVIDTMIALEPNEDFSLFVIDEFDKVSVMMLWDRPSLPAAGQAKLRFINLSPDSQPVQLKIKGVTTPLTTGQSFTEASQFLDLESNTYSFEVLSGGNVIDELPETQLQGGWFYTIIVKGYVNPPTGNTNAIGAEIMIN